MRTEAQVLAALVATFRAWQQAGAPIWWLKVHGGVWQRAGVPDLIGTWEGLSWAIECKAPGKAGEVSPRQRIELDALSRAGAIVGVADSVASGLAVLRVVAHRAGVPLPVGPESARKRP